MAIKDIFKISRKTFLNPSGWLGYDMLAGQTRTIWSILKDQFTPERPLRTETFEEAVKRQKLSEADVQSLSSNYLFTSFLFAFFGLFTLVFGFYLLFHHATAAGWLLAMATSALFFTYALRYHFWHFQIKHRKLGCTLKEWWEGQINNEGSSS